MSMEKYGFIYITTNILDNKKYIGQKKYDKRSDNYLGSGIHLKYAIKKYGRENFTREILEECDNKNMLDEREIYWIDFYNAVNSNEYYNIASGGEGGNTIAGYTVEQLKLNSLKKSIRLKGVINQGTNNPMAKRVICLNTMEIFSTTIEAGKQYNVKDYMIQQACRDNSQVRTAGLHPVTKERLMWKYYKENEKYEYIPFKINKEKSMTKIICINTQEIFNSMIEASIKYNIISTKISSNCNHYCRYGGFDTNGNPMYWIKYDEYLKFGIREIYYQRDKIQQFDLNGRLVNYFKTIVDASKYTGITGAKIKKNICGVIDHIDGYIFKQQYT